MQRAMRQLSRRQRCLRTVSRDDPGTGHWRTVLFRVVYPLCVALPMLSSSLFA